MLAAQGVWAQDVPATDATGDTATVPEMDGGMGMGMHGGMDGGMGGPMGMGGPLADFAAIDADGNGLVTPQEIAAHAAARFAAADSDGDGGLDAVEMAAAIQAARADDLARMAARMAVGRIARVDDNGDGLVQASEMQARMPPLASLFDRVDTDSDGAISTAEAETARAAMLERGGDRRHRGGHGDGHGQGEGRRGWAAWFGFGDRQGD